MPIDRIVHRRRSNHDEDNVADVPNVENGVVKSNLTVQDKWSIICN